MAGVGGSTGAGLPRRGEYASTTRVFPLPLQPLPPTFVIPRSRREQVRHRHRRRLVSVLNVVLTALNALALHGAASSSSLSPSPLQARVIRSVFIRVRSFVSGVRRRDGALVAPGLCDSLFRSVGSIFAFTVPSSISLHPFSELTKLAASGWEAGSAPPLHHLSNVGRGVATSLGDFASYIVEPPLRDRAVPVIAHRIALPSDFRPVELLSVLPSTIAELYSAPSPALLLDAPRPVKRRPRVFGSHVEYVRLVRRLLSIGMVSLTVSPKCVNGVFAVPKDAAEDRLIVDAVFANACFAEPSKVRLPDPSHLARLRVPKGRRLFVAKSDLSNYYHHLALPVWLRPYFCLVGVPAAEFGLPGGGLVYPMLHTVPMGWSHSVNVAQAAHEHTLYASGALQRERNLLSLLAASNDGFVDVTDEPLHGIYIDDAFVISLAEDATNAELDRCLASYQREGFVVKPSKVLRATTSATVLGLLIDGVRLSVQVSPADRLQLLQSVLRLLAQRTITGHQLASVVGSLTWCMLVRRPALQCFHRVYRFVLSRKGKPSQLWPSAFRELVVACGLLPLLSADLAAPMASRLIASDACEFGGAVVAAVPRRDCWSTIIRHRWRWPEHINALELRAVLLGLLWLVSCRVLNRRVRMLVDSMVCLGVLLKGRTSSRTLHRIHAVVAALCLGAGLVLVPTYVPSELNPADGPSRFRHEAAVHNDDGG